MNFLINDQEIEPDADDLLFSLMIRGTKVFPEIRDIMASAAASGLVILI
jgi:hypothetical protein